MSDVGKWNRPWLRSKDEESLLRFCPRCGSTSLTWVGGLPVLAPHMECKECGHRGVFILGDSDMIQAVRKGYLDGKRDAQGEEDEEDDE